MTSARTLVTGLDEFLAREEDIAGDHRTASKAIRDCLEMYEDLIDKMSKVRRQYGVEETESNNGVDKPGASMDNGLE